MKSHGVELADDYRSSSPLFPLISELGNSRLIYHQMIDLKTGGELSPWGRDSAM